MAQNHPIFVYDQNCIDFTTTGMVGDLRPISATFKEEKNGISEVEIRLPYDQLKKWQACKVGNLLQCEVPVRVPPVIQDDEYANTVPIAEVPEV